MVGLLVAQHQVVRCVNDDLLQADEGAQQPGGQEGDHGGGDLRHSAHAASGTRLQETCPTTAQHILSLGRHVGA